MREGNTRARALKEGRSEMRILSPPSGRWSGRAVIAEELAERDRVGQAGRRGQGGRTVLSTTWLRHVDDGVDLRFAITIECSCERSDGGSPCERRDQVSGH